MMNQKPREKKLSQELPINAESRKIGSGKDPEV